ncbi:MAG TPA: DMT family transporter [Rhodocyclaceae bacterium]|jgi:drug/metabolite transporter (DMT)-like permease|nr:DMT family transporter [Rhodocyclaceae bacterium]
MTTENYNSTHRSGYLAALVVIFCWSGFNIVSRLAGRSVLTPFDIAALRVGIASLILLPLFVRILWQALQASDVRLLLQYLSIAIFGSLGYALPVYSGFAFAPAAHAGVLVNGGIPLATALLAWFALGQRPRGWGAFSLAIAISGIVMIGLQSFALAGGNQWIGDLFFVFGAVSWAIAGLLMRRWHLKPIPTVAMMNGLAAILYLPVYVLFLPSHLHEAPMNAVLLQGTYQGFVAAIIAGIFYNHANLTIGPQKASLMLALVPGITAIAAVPILGESLSALAIFGVLLITAGAILGAVKRG